MVSFKSNSDRMGGIKQTLTNTIEVFHFNSISLTVLNMFIVFHWIAWSVVVYAHRCLSESVSKELFGSIFELDGKFSLKNVLIFL